MPRSTSAKAPAKKAVAKKAPPATVTEENDFAGPAGDDWFVPLDDTLDYVNVLFYGNEGTGKTTNGARLANTSSLLPPGKGKILVINAEGGLKKKALLKRGVDTDRIVVWPRPGNRVSYVGLDEVFRRVKADLVKDPDSWCGVMFDSATDIHIELLDKVQANRVKKLIDKGTEADPDFVDRSDYGSMGKQFRDILRKFRDLPCHFIVTALIRRDVDKDTGKPSYGPAVTPALQADLLGYVDLVIMCKAEDEDGPFRGLTRANSRYRAKDRFDVTPKIMVDPYMDRIFGYLTDDLDPETDPEQERYTKAGKDVNKSKNADDDAISNDDEDDEGED